MSEAENKGRGKSNQTDRSDRSDRTDRTEKPKKQERLRPSGGYRKLRSFQTTSIIYDGTVLFCDRFMDKRSRTVDQMVQAARSGRQNIAEGSRASAASSQTELRLTSMWPVPALTSCCLTSKTSCGNAVCCNGQKTIPGRLL